jgi:hypothetical protein
VSSAANAPAGTIVTASVSCPAGTVVLGGGARVTVSAATQNQRVVLRASYPSSTTAWTAEAIVITTLTGGNTGRITPYVLCSP